MLEETNDNLLDADGNLENKAIEIVQSETEVLEETETIEPTNSEIAEEITENVETVSEEISADADVIIETENQTALDSETPVLEEIEIVEPSNSGISEEIIENVETLSEEISTDADATIETENQTALDSETPVLEDIEIVEPNNSEITEISAAVSDGELTETNTIIDAIADTNAEESEDETLKERHNIPMLDYDALSLEALVAELENLVTNEKVMSVKDHVEEIKKSFLAKYYHLLEEKKEEFLAESQGSGTETNEEFQYSSPTKAKFDQYYSLFRDNKNTHFKSLQTNLKTNLENRLAIVEELKELINPQANIKDTLKHFNDLRERWKNAGAIPKDKYNHVWNNYHFHVENFYDYLHLDREARDLDFKHNLEQKQKIVARVEELVNEADINKAFRELQDLHKIWKEDIGPVSREHRDEIWNKFSDLTKQMHDKREVLFENLRGTELENLEKKKEIIAKIEVLATEKVNAHSQWLGQIEKVEALRTAFFSAGKVPSEVNEETWAGFKTAVRNFNSFKNSFYKDIKKDQNNNLTRKTALVAKAKELQESTDFAVTTPIMKQIQEEWKQIGHVPRKYSDKIWIEFKEACNHYFDKLKEQKNEENGEEVEAFDKKKAYLETLREFQLTGEHKTDLDAIKLHIETWKGFGRVPFTRRHIEGKFNKVLDALFEKLSLSKKDTEMMRFSNRMDHLSENNDTRKLEGEKIFLMRKIDEIKNEIFQLENNIQFFTNTRNAKKENSIVLEVRKNIEKHKEEMEILKDKLKQVRNLNQA